MENTRNQKIVFAAGLILLAAVSRLFPILPNFQPVIAIAIFAGAVFTKNRILGFAIPLTAMLLSDILLHFFSESMLGYYAGFSYTTLLVYISFALIVFLGMKTAGNMKPLNIFGTSLFSAILFYVITNFSSWIFGLDINNQPYSKYITGFIRCYTEAIPFFKYTLGSALLYSAILFGAYLTVEKLVLSPVKVKNNR